MDPDARVPWSLLPAHRTADPPPVRTSALCHGWFFPDAQGERFHQPLEGAPVTTTLAAAHEVPQRALRRIVELATRAPSVHNAQPWRWRGGPHSLELYADRSRRCP